MRYLLFTFLTGALFAACSGGKNDKAIATAMTDSAHFTTIQWLDSVRDYGKIPEGQKLDVSFRFVNTGSLPLVIGRVQPSCGCTIAEQPQEPVAPGKEGVIRAHFDSDGRTGINHKTLFVFANTRGIQEHRLQFMVEVQKKNS